jgi:hypothetical protein
MKKRILTAVLLTLFVVALFSSCKSKDCPAYDQSTIEVSIFSGE